MEWLGIKERCISSPESSSVSILISKWNGWEYAYLPTGKSNGSVSILISKWNGWEFLSGIYFFSVDPRFNPNF